VLKLIVFLKKNNSVIIYSSSCRSEHIQLSFVCKTQKDILKMSHVDSIDLAIPQNCYQNITITIM